MDEELARLDRVDDLETAREWAKLYARENARLRSQLADIVELMAKAEGKDATQQLALRLMQVQEELGNLQRKTFGDSSERRATADEDHEEVAKEKQRGHGPRKQPALRVEQIRLELPEEFRECSVCGEQLEEMGDQVEVTEQITSRIREYIVQELVAPKYRCKCGGQIKTAPRPPTHIKGGRYSLDFAIDVAIDKYVNHLPLDRQRRMMGRAGLVIDTQTLFDQLDGLTSHLEPAYEATREYILDADVVGADETWWRLMDSKGSKRWWVWSLTTHDAVWHGIRPSRSAAAAREFLGDFEGTVLADGYKAYDTLAAENDAMKLAHCWAHARRKFVEAEPNYPQCSEALDLIGKLFTLDRGLQSPAQLDGDARRAAEIRRLELRNRDGRPILDALRAWALAQQGLPKSGLRKAIDYMLRYWQGLTAFLDDPYIPLDNNATERALRGIVIGRKNHYGSRSQRGTEVAAILYTLLETCLLNGVDPRAYLKRAVERSVLVGDVVLPWNHPG